MNLQYEYLPAEHIGRRRHEAQQQRFVRHAARARRLIRRADRLADRARVSQVLQNLIENAVHFSPAGGRVEVALAVVGPRHERHLECSVKDSGPGFDPADLPRLFEPFFTRRRGGTGLGLSIVKRIVYDHGGEVSAQNHPQGGAVVTVKLRAVGGGANV